MSSFRIALIGNANVGKSTLFNRLCGLKQKTGNYPGVTVDKKKGSFIHDSHVIELIDLPGFNSLNPTSLDEELVYQFLMSDKDKVDQIVFVANALDLKKSLYLFTQLRDLGFPIAVAINFSDIASKKGILIDANQLSIDLGVPVVLLSARKGEGVETLKDAMINVPPVKEVDLSHFAKPEIHDKIKHEAKNGENLYISFLSLAKKNKSYRIKESILRYQFITAILKNAYSVNKDKATDFTSKLDRILLHQVGGYVVLMAILFLVFQCVFWLATYPMDWIDAGMGELKDFTASSLPQGALNDLLVGGVLEGLGGVVIFIPQIAILFFLFSLLEESGYMNRAVYLLDSSMQKIGMSGKSVVPLVSSFACAVPSIMATRTIQNRKERLITILVAPLITCSARIPVYTVIIAIIIPNETWGGFNLQGLVLLGMYLLGVFTTVIAALVFKFIIKGKYKSFFIIEMPDYLIPSIGNVLLSMWSNTKSFVLNAGKIIVAVTIIIFVLQSNGNGKFNGVEEAVSKRTEWTPDQKEYAIKTIKEENSFLAIGGKAIEPVLIPLGYDWKVGVGVIASIAAREVFVGTMLVVYGDRDLEDDLLIADHLGQQINANTGKRTFNFATGISLLLFYAFSLQCMSTIAVTYKETKSLKWTSIQFLYMTVLAYITALIAYQTLS